MNSRLLQLSQEELIERYARGERDFSEFGIRFSQYGWHSSKKIRVKNNLSSMDFSDANLANIVISGCNLKKSNFSNANLSNASLGGYADFSNANLFNIDLSNAKLGSVNFSNANLQGANFSNASFAEYRFKNQQRINFSGANLTNAVFTNDSSSCVDLSGVDLSNADLSGVNLKRVILMGAVLKGTKIENAIGILPDEELVWKIVNHYPIDENIADFDLTGANFAQADLNNINFQGVHLSKCIFIGSNLENANLSNTNLEEANFSNADLSNANLSKSNLNKAILYSANLHHANLDSANLSKILDNKTNFKEAINVPESFLKSKMETNLTRALDEIFDYHCQYNPDIILCLQPGLTREEIDELLENIPYTIPEEIYQLYGWRNGMSKKGIQNYGYLAFAKARGFRPLEEAVKYYKYTSRTSKCSLEIFPSANDYSASYVVDLGGEKVAPVRNFDTEHEHSIDAFETKYYSILSMMSSCNSSKR